MNVHAGLLGMGKDKRGGRIRKCNGRGEYDQGTLYECMETSSIVQLTYANKII
jgi:hypothetical protein